VFAEIHALEDVCSSLEFDCLNDIINEPDAIGDATWATKFFRNNRSSFVMDSNNLRIARDNLERARESVDLLFTQHNFLLKVVQESKRNPAPDAHKEVKELNANAKWLFGVARGAESYHICWNPWIGQDIKPVELADGTKASECLLKVELEKSFFSPGGILNFVTGWDMRTHHVETGERQTFAYTASAPELMIIGFTLTCNNANRKAASFRILSGGLLQDHLSIRVNKPKKYEWHCRVTYVEMQGSMAKLWSKMEK
jgi:hypothetical protein